MLEKWPFNFKELKASILIKNRQKSTYFHPLQIIFKAKYTSPMTQPDISSNNAVFE